MSPARQHRERILAAQATNAALPGIAAPPPTSGAAAMAYEQMLLQLHEDRRRLHDIQSVEKKIALKRDLLPAYAAWVEGALTAGRESGRAVQDEVIVNVLPWLIDVGAYRDAIAVAEHVLRFRLVMPERFKRTPACYVTEEIAEASIAATTAASSSGSTSPGTGFNVPALLQLEEITEGHDMPDEVRAKLHKAIGLELARQADAASPDDDTLIAGFVPASRTEALARLNRALALNGKAGVKKNIEALERALKKDAPVTTATSG